jgi:hypothetical protein
LFLKDKKEIPAVMIIQEEQQENQPDDAHEFLTVP